jgi:hypothetical protein
MIRVHVMPTGRDWAIRVLGETIHRTFSPAAAEQFARQYLGDQGGGELVVHDAGGVSKRSRVSGRTPTTDPGA